MKNLWYRSYLFIIMSWILGNITVNVKEENQKHTQLRKGLLRIYSNVVDKKPIGLYLTHCLHHYFFAFPIFLNLSDTFLFSISYLSSIINCIWFCGSLNLALSIRHSIFTPIVPHVELLCLYEVHDARWIFSRFLLQERNWSVVKQAQLALSRIFHAYPCNIFKCFGYHWNLLLGNLLKTFH